MIDNSVDRLIMNRFVVLGILFITCWPFHQSDALVYIWNKIQKIMTIRPRSKFDKAKCLHRPEKFYAHFVDDQVYPNEIHTFYINESKSKSKNELGRNLKQVSKRILQINHKFPIQSNGFTVFMVKACTPNEAFLRPSWQ